MNPPIRCPSCSEEALAPMDVVDGAHLCAACKGVFARGDALAALVGGPMPLAPAPIDLDAVAPACPLDGSPLTARWAFGDEALEVGTCTACGAVAFPPGRLAAVRAASQARAPRERVRPPSPARGSGEGDALPVDRLGFDSPAVQLVALPLAFVASIALVATRFGRLLAFPVQIVFHELGHAIPSWLGSRAALPLPCGITFTREDPSFFTGASFVFLLGVLAVAGHRERRPFAVVVAAGLFAAFLVVTFGLSADRWREIMLLGGIAGEIVLGAFAVASFYFPMPDRLRWDFFRIVVMPLGALSLVASARLWIAIARGEEGMPLGSLFGAHGDGTGDLDRLMAEFDWTRDALVGLYLTLAALACAALLALYGVFGLRTLAASRRRR